MIKREAITDLVDQGIVESEEYYHDVEFNIFPLLDYLRTNEIKQLLNMDEYKVFKDDNFDNENWISILREEQNENLIFKFRETQIEIAIGKIFN